MTKTTENQHNVISCPHHDRILTHSRKIEKLETMSDIKDRKIEELKQDMKELIQKIDTVNDNVNQLILDSKSDDNKLDLRLTAIETKQVDLERQIADNQEEADRRTNRMLTTVGIGITLLTVGLDLLFHFL